MHQIEFHIAASSYFLPVSVLPVIGKIFSTYHNRKISFKETVPNIRNKIIPLLFIFFFSWSQIIKK